MISAGGPAIPSLDPVAHRRFELGPPDHTAEQRLPDRHQFADPAAEHRQFRHPKGFLTGTSVSLGLNNNSVTSNNPRNDFNPATNSSLALSFSQHLLQGFGTALNSRQIRIARNNREVSDLTFKLQVETTVAAVMELYWDLVSFNQAVQVGRDALAASQQLLENNRKQVEVGTLAQIEVVRAEAEIASREQTLVVAQTRALQQETIIKTALSRTGVASPAIASAHIITTDRITVPDVEPITPIQDMTAHGALRASRTGAEPDPAPESAIDHQGFEERPAAHPGRGGQLSNGALAGDTNPLPAPAGTAHSNTAFFIGGYGTVLSQLFARNFPNYSVGLNLNIPIRNRAAQAQVITDELTYRQQQLVLQRLENQVRVDVQNAMIGVSQARAQYIVGAKSASSAGADAGRRDRRSSLWAHPRFITRFWRSATW